MVKRIILAVVMAAVLAVPSFAAVQNVKVSGDLKTTSVIRNDMAAAQSRDRQAEILSQVGLNVQADLTDNVSTMIRLGNERFWGESNTSDANQVNLDEAYVTMKEFLYAPLTLTIGRQPLVYGNQLIIGDFGSYNEVANITDLTGGANFDAIKAVLNYDPLTVDIFAARINNGAGTTASTTNTHDNTNAYGVNANYKLGDKMSTVVEGYIFAKTHDQADVSALTRAERTYVPGLRVSTNPIEGLNVQLEMAYQMGSATNSGSADQLNDSRNAWALQTGMNYALPVLKDMKPVVAAKYTFLSGSRAQNNGDIHKVGKTWDTMYMNQNVGRIFHAKGQDGSNSGYGSQLLTISGELTPIKDITTMLSWNGVWLAEKANRTSSASSSKYLGSEVDLDVTYAYTEDVTFGVSAGAYLTGKNAIVPDNKDAQQLLTSVKVAF